MGLGDFLWLWLVTAVSYAWEHPIITILAITVSAIYGWGQMTGGNQKKFKGFF